MRKRLALSTASLILIALAGCSAGPTFDDAMKTCLDVYGKHFNNTDTVEKLCLDSADDLGQEEFTEAWTNEGAVRLVEEQLAG